MFLTRKNFQNCDIVWFESVSRCLVDVSQKANCKILIKLNESDVDSEILDRINWGNVERVFVPEVNYIKKQLFDRLPLLQIQTTVTTYADVVDLKEFELQNLGPGKSLVCLDDICAENNPMGLIQCMQKLNYIDRDYKLFFAGDIQNHQLENYMRFMVRRLGLDSCVFFDNCSHDLAAYLENKHYVVSGSVSQKFNERILQAMACGLKPVIHNGPLASKKFKSKFLFNISEDFCKTVLSEDYNPIEYRRFVEDKYSLSKQLSIFHKIIVDLEKQIESSDRSFSLESVENLSSSLGSKVKNQSLQQNNLVSSY